MDGQECNYGKDLKIVFIKKSDCIFKDDEIVGLKESPEIIKMDYEKYLKHQNMTKTNSYQRAKARVKELEEHLQIATSKNRFYLEHLDISNNDIKDLITEIVLLKEQLTKERNTVKAFIVLSLMLTIGIIVLIANI